MIHAELDHREPVRRVQTEQRERQADVVVEVARRREPRVFADRSREDRRDHLLDRRLAVAARDRDERHREALAPAVRQRTERGARVLYLDDRKRPGIALRGSRDTSAAAAPLFAT